jgi:protein-S-isoprenylcysteine O-methyltransferase Ste14
MLSRIPSLLIGICLAIYWARVLHLARKIRRSAGHTANIIPPGFLGCITRAIWFPIVALWIALPLAVPLIHNPPKIFQPLFISPLLAWLALAIAVISFVLTLICWKKMGNSWRMGIDPAEKTALIVTGPYAFIRHPIYALSSLLVLATVAVMPSPLMILVALIHLVLLQFEARREEKYLINLHGPAYSNYCNHVSRFIPLRISKMKKGDIHNI